MVGAVASLMVGGVFLFLAPVAWRGGFNVSSATLPLALAAVPAGAALVALMPAAAAVYGVLTAREMFLFASGLRLFQGAGRLLAAVAVVSTGGGVAGVLWAQASVDLVAVAVGFVWSWRWVGPAPVLAAAGPQLRLGRAGVVTVLAVGLPFALVVLLSGLLADAEKLALGMIRSVEDFTYYTVPFNAVIKFTVVSGAVARVLLPRLAALGARGDAAEALELTERADRILVTGMVAAMVPVVVLAPELLRIWVGDDFAVRSSPASRILLVGVALNAAAIPGHSVVLARGRPSYLTYLLSAELIVHLVVVYLLVTAFGLVGAATAWTVRMGLDMLAQRKLAEHTLGLDFRDNLEVWSVLVLYALFAALTTVLSLPWRIVAGAIIGATALLFIARGAGWTLLLDSFLPWRWGKRRPL